MRTQVEAPATEPPHVERRRRPRRAQGVRRRRRARRRGPARAARASWSRSSARAAAGSRRCWSWCAGSRSPTRARSSAPPAALMPQRDALLPWLSALDNAALARRVAGDSPARGARGGARALRGLRARGLRALAARGAVGRDAPAGRVPAHAARRAAAAVPGRAVRGAGRADARAGPDVARRRAGARAAHRAAGDARRRGGGPAGRPRRAALAASGRVVAELDVRSRARARERASRSSSCASARWPRWGWRRERAGGRGDARGGRAGEAGETARDGRGARAAGDETRAGERAARCASGAPRAAVVAHRVPRLRVRGRDVVAPLVVVLVLLGVWESWCGPGRGRAAAAGADAGRPGAVGGPRAARARPARHHLRGRGRARGGADPGRRAGGRDAPRRPRWSARCGRSWSARRPCRSR